MFDSIVSIAQSWFIDFGPMVVVAVVTAVVAGIAATVQAVCDR